jgi:glutathione synthase/RimK-type ligase-like ATP-grasp enzyme
MTDIVLVTCARWPDLSESDRLYARALEARGASVRAAPWNGPLEPFDAADATVMRAAWDYFEAPEAFADWLDALSGRRAAVHNPPAMMRWNLDKRYLLDLADRGVSVPETRVVPSDPEAVTRAIEAMGDGPVVVKPSVGQSGHHVARADGGTVPAAIVHAAGRPVIVQRFVPEVQESGELSCVFFDGAFSHAFLKRPAPGEYRVNSQYNGHNEPVTPSGSTIEQAGAVLTTLPETPLYARVDGVLRDGQFILMELELIEPGLGLQLDPRAAVHFADATMRRIGHARG